MDVVWTEPAREDYRSQVQYVLERNPRAADRVATAVRHAVEGLTTLPNRGRPGRMEGTRELVVPGLPYVVVYRVAGAGVQVLRVLHGAQDWPSQPAGD